MEGEFSKDLKELGNADLIYWLAVMEEDSMEGAAHDIRKEMVWRFCHTNWSYFEDLMERDGEGYEW